MILKNLTRNDTAKILGGIAPITISRLSKADPTFPKFKKVGKSLFLDGDLFYAWLTQKAGFLVRAPDTAITIKDVQSIYSKSHTWIHTHIKSGALPKPFKVGRFTFWMASQFK